MDKDQKTEVSHQSTTLSEGTAPVQRTADEIGVHGTIQAAVHRTGTNLMPLSNQ